MNPGSSTATLFDLDPVAFLTVPTQSIKYAGSKLKILPHILETVRDIPVNRVWDAFSGSTRVSQAFAKQGYEVESNDISAWSETLASAYLCNTSPPESYHELIEHLNALPPVDGWFTQNYGGEDYNGSAVQPDGSKKVWQRHNTQKLDAIREEIDRLQLGKVEKAVALTSLLLALDKVDSTVGHFVSYLKDWSPRSYGELSLEVPALWVNKAQHLVTRRNVLDSCNPSSVGVDLAYFDPPYGSNNEKMPPSRVRYQSYYHLWATVVTNDKPELFGAASRRVDSRDAVSASPFEDFRRNDESGKFIALEAINSLISNANVPWVLLSYSNGGRATAAELNEVLSANGKIQRTISIDHKRNVMSQMRWTDEWLNESAGPNQELLFLLEKH